MGIIDSIKKDAFDKNAKIQDAESAKLEKILNRAFYLDKNVKEETKFVEQVMTRGMETQERIGLHASALIKDEAHFCLRAQVLSLIYRQLQGEQIGVNLKRIFEEGNAVHEKWQRLFIRAGYSKAEDLDVTMLNDEYMISYTPDIICEIIEFFNGKMVGEVKSMNTFQFKKMVEKGGKHPSAGKQLQWYMFLTGIHKGFVLTEDKNSQDFYIEVYDYDPELTELFVMRAKKIIHQYKRALSEGKMVKRPMNATSPDCKRCASCAMKDSCWNLPGGKKRICQKTQSNVKK